MAAMVESTDIARVRDPRGQRRAAFALLAVAVEALRLATDLVEKHKLGLYEENYDRAVPMITGLVVAYGCVLAGGTA